LQTNLRQLFLYQVAPGVCTVTAPNVPFGIRVIDTEGGRGRQVGRQANGAVNIRPCIQWSLIVVYSLHCCGHMYNG
jgi:hypothetical protein